MLGNMILPLISLVSGLVSLYIDPRRDKGKAWIVIAVLSASAIATGINGYADNRDSAHRVSEANAKLDAANEELIKLETSTRQGMDAIVDALKPFGILTTATGKISNNRLQQSLAADVARRQELQAIAKNPSPERPAIEYFTKDLDKEVVTKALQESGLKFRKAPARVTDDPTNSVWVGDAVPLADVKFVALTLLRAGVQLRAVRRFHDGSGAKTHLIEIGADRAVDNSPVLTVEQIENMRELPPRDSTGASGS
jgi:hypothetical protein